MNKSMMNMEINKKKYNLGIRRLTHKIIMNSRKILQEITLWKIRCRVNLPEIFQCQRLSLTILQLKILTLWAVVVEV